MRLRARLKSFPIIRRALRSGVGTPSCSRWRSYVPEFTVLEMGEVSPQGVAQALENLYSNPTHRQRLAQAGFALTQRPEYSWDGIPQKFDDLFVTLAI